MTDDRRRILAQIEASLIEALREADNIDEALLGAKLDEALTCVREINTRG